MTLHSGDNIKTECEKVGKVPLIIPATDPVIFASLYAAFKGKLPNQINRRLIQQFLTTETVEGDFTVKKGECSLGMYGVDFGTPGTVLKMSLTKIKEPIIIDEEDPRCPKYGFAYSTTRGNYILGVMECEGSPPEVTSGSTINTTVNVSVAGIGPCPGGSISASVSGDEITISTSGFESVNWYQGLGERGGIQRGFVIPVGTPPNQVNCLFFTTGTLVGGFNFRVPGQTCDGSGTADIMSSSCGALLSLHQIN